MESPPEYVAPGKTGVAVGASSGRDCSVDNTPHAPSQRLLASAAFYLPSLPSHPSHPYLPSLPSHPF
eukprot:118314-Chlamydomonas_euryale.AAC.1